jgi:hypothetical protein
MGIDTSCWKAAQTQLAEIVSQLYALAPSVSTTLEGVSGDTYHALGLATGQLEKLKALLGRDIDQEASNG